MAKKGAKFTGNKLFAYWRRSFSSRLIGIFKHHIPANASILNFGCGDGTLLKSLNPRKGYGVDNKIPHRNMPLDDSPNLIIEDAELETLTFDEKFDAIILNYTCGRLEDIQKVLENLKTAAHHRTRLYVTTQNMVWLPFLRIGRTLGIIQDPLQDNWLSHMDLGNLLDLAGWEVVQLRWEQLCPLEVPLLTTFFNRWLGRLPWLEQLGLTILHVARPKCAPVFEGNISCSVIIPARNESGHILDALIRIPVLGKQTEVIFVEGNSTDDTWEVIQRAVKSYAGPHLVSCCQQKGKGKWDAVYTGFSRASGDVLVIQDGDLTAPPEDLPKFYNSIISGQAEFANGSRLVYPMEKRAMRFLNVIGNKFFAIALSMILRQPIKDSLCGTKMLLRTDYEKLLQRIKVLGDFDPFGDFNLLFGSSLLNLKIRDIPVRYRERVYGDTNISRFRHGLILLRMTWFALKKIRFHG